MRRLAIIVLSVMALGCASARLPAESLTCAIANHTAEDRDDLVRLPVRPSRPFVADAVKVMIEGREAICQVDVLDGSRARACRADIWVRAVIPARTRRTYLVETVAATDGGPEESGIRRDGRGGGRGGETGIAATTSVPTSALEIPVWDDLRFSGPAHVEVELPAAAASMDSMSPVDSPVSAVPAASSVGPSQVSAITRDGFHLLGNGLVEVRIPVATRDPSAGPIAGVRAGDGPWRGSSAWENRASPLKASTATVIVSGPLFARVRVRTTFANASTPVDPTFFRQAQPLTTSDGDGVARDGEPFSQVDITIRPGEPGVRIDEVHRMRQGDAWVLRLGAGWAVTDGLLHGWSRATGPITAPTSVDSGLTLPLKPWARLGTTLAWLQPRWTQGCDVGWCFSASDGADVMGALAAWAGRWDWPYDNLIAVRVDDSGNVADLVCPTVKGARSWFLFAGTRSVHDQAKALATRLAFRPLDKLVNQYRLDWPGQADGGFPGRDFYDGASTNPTAGIRAQARMLLANLAKGRPPGATRGTLATVEMHLDPDWFPAYRNRWSPINPNFNTDFLRIPILNAIGLKTHPDFPRLARRIEDAFRQDLDFSVTMPGGAGQECPGYTSHALESWRQLAPLCQEHLGFDPRTWPRYQAAIRFLAETSQPLGDGSRRILPTGDTHPPGMDVMALAKESGIAVDVAALPSREYPGFGAVLRSASGTAREQFLAFKSGPNRGHYHGDQLSFHYSADGAPAAIDHMCSYEPRADQEHLHNRVAFAPRGWDHANMDGYERLIAFCATPMADVAVGEVESRRLRRMPRTPQEIPWQPRWDLAHLDQPMVYRRAIVLVKGGAADYYVIRDSHRGVEVTATYCLHGLGDEVRQDGRRFIFPHFSLFCAEPETPAVERFDWSYSKRKSKDGKPPFSESTVGIRLSTTGATSRFTTVLWPGANPPAMEPTADGVRIGEDEVRFIADGSIIVQRGRDVTTVLPAQGIDRERSQGEVGLFIPEAGYDFGPVPEWLVRQRDRDWPMTP